MACLLRRPGRVPSSPRRQGRSKAAARRLWDGAAALVPAWQGGRGIGRLTPVVVASREAAHPAKVERQIADQVAGSRVADSQTSGGDGWDRMRLPSENHLTGTHPTMHAG